MAEFVPNQLTVRERALAALEQAIRTQPVGDYGFAWDLVVRAPLRDWAYRKQRSLGIFDGRETKRDLHMVRECSLAVALEIKLVVQSNAQPSSEMNAYFGAVQRRLAEDPTLGGLVIDLVETGNDSDVEDENQRHVAGVLLYTMKYRHAVKDPRRIV